MSSEIITPQPSNIRLGGRLPSDPDRKHLNLSDYLKEFPPPPECDYSAKAVSLQQVFLNNQLGNCVIAAGYHVVGTETGNAGSGFIASDQQIIKDYGAITGFVFGDPSTDNGTDIPTALDYWTKTGFADGTKLVAYLAVDATNRVEVMQALYLFENLMMGIALPDTWVNPFPSANGFVWNNGPANHSNGHCVMGVGYNAQGIQIDTWGLIGTVVWEAIASLCSKENGGELFVLLTPDQLAKGTTVAPNGIAWTDLITDFNIMGGNAPVLVTSGTVS